MNWGTLYVNTRNIVKEKTFNTTLSIIVFNKVFSVFSKANVILAGVQCI
jgi:hypothetical protein